jgi:2-isopropylmalate synthase
VNGLGERCGNADLVAVIANLALKKDRRILTRRRLAQLTELARYVYETANMFPPDGQPFVGPAAFAHKGGMHVHAVSRDPSTYEHVDPALVGNVRHVLVSELSGVSNITFKARDLGIDVDDDTKRRVLARLQELENDGYQFEAAEASFDLLVRKLAGRHRPYFELAAFRVIDEKRAADEAPITEATVKLRVAGTLVHTASEGDGPVNALDGAFRNALERFYPSITEMRLVDYKVRVVNPKAATAARVRVVIESRDKTDVWGTVGVSENIIEASWLALVDSVEYKLYKDKVRPRTR